MCLNACEREGENVCERESVCRWVGGCMCMFLGVCVYVYVYVYALVCVCSQGMCVCSNDDGGGYPW